MQGLKLNHVSKRGHWSVWYDTYVQFCVSLGVNAHNEKAAYDWYIPHCRTLTIWDASPFVTSSKNAWVSKSQDLLLGVARSYWSHKLLRPREEHMLQCTGLSLFQTLAWWLLGACHYLKQSWLFINWIHRNNFQSNLNQNSNIFSQKCICKYLQNVGNFVSASMC